MEPPVGAHVDAIPRSRGKNLMGHLLKALKKANHTWACLVRYTSRSGTIPPRLSCR
jgi:hypothetical protein